MRCFLGISILDDERQSVGRQARFDGTSVNAGNLDLLRAGSLPLGLPLPAFALSQGLQLPFSSKGQVLEDH